VGFAGGFLNDTPFKRGPVTVLRLESTVEGARTRRLEAGTQATLLHAADPHLRAVLVAALTTGCRIGELLSLHTVRTNQSRRPRRSRRTPPLKPPLS
jgi:hypothetical protein